MKSSYNLRFIALVVICVGLNLGIGLAVTAAKLPIYLDSLGTLLATVLGGLWVGVLCGIFSSIIGSVFTPTLWSYAGTMVAIAVYTSLVRPLGYLNKSQPTAIFGIGLGVVCAIISAPVTTYLWTGVTLSGTDSVTAYFSARGWSFPVSVIFANLSTDPLDKLVTSLLALVILRRIPGRFFAAPTTRESTDK
jgi:energy-coupling factor transport system substrate-specific component